MAFIEPRAVFFSSLDAKGVIFHLAGGDRTVPAYFDNSFLDSNLGETQMDTTAPRVTCEFSKVEDIPVETVVTIAGKDFNVVQIQPDGTGMAIVVLAYE